MDATVFGIGIVVAFLGFGGTVVLRTPAFAVTGGLGSVIAVVGLMM
jgi:hypothetical protein